MRYRRLQVRMRIVVRLRSEWITMNAIAPSFGRGTERARFHADDRGVRIRHSHSSGPGVCRPSLRGRSADTSFEWAASCGLCTWMIAGTRREHVANPPFAAMISTSLSAWSK